MLFFCAKTPKITLSALKRAGVFRVIGRFLCAGINLGNKAPGTRPNLTGSSPTLETIGIVVVTALRLVLRTAGCTANLKSCSGSCVTSIAGIISAGTIDC